MAYKNLPGVFVDKQDGGLQITNPNTQKRILILGTAEQGDTEVPYLVRRTKEAVAAFGTAGTLARGLYEVSAGAAGVQIMLMRVGATSAILSGIGQLGSHSGISIETAMKDDGASAAYEFYWDDTAKRLVVQNVATGQTVWDRDFLTEDVPSIDLGEVYVTGDFDHTAGGVNIGSASSFLTLDDAEDTGTLHLSLTEGTDVANPSRMELYEALFKAYGLLEAEKFDFVVPMNVYLDDRNVVDSLTFTASPSSSYPTAGTANDMLLYFYTEEYNGKQYFWWRHTEASGAPDIYPATYSTTSPNGVTLASQAFSEVNFAYQLADFCYRTSSTLMEIHGFIGVRPPASFSLKDVSAWIGKLPTYAMAEDGSFSISSSPHNGSGLLGNKFMAGKYGFRANAGGGGMIANDKADGTLGGTELDDDGGHVIDIGAYISVVGQWVTLFNQIDTSGLGYKATMAPTYAGFVAPRDPKSAPTNKVIANVTLPCRINNAKQDDLAGCHYVFCMHKPKGTVISDAPTAARFDSDFTRLTTVLCVKDVIDAIRTVSDPFIGEANTALQRAALQTAVEGALAKLQKAGEIQRFQLSVTATAAQQVAGDATIELQIVPAFELRQITVKLSLATM